MKSKFTVALGLAALIGLSACVSLDENIVSGVTASFYETPDGVNAAVNAAYSGLWDMYGEEDNMTMLEYGTDIWAVGADGSRKYYNAYTAQLEPREGYNSGLWERIYRDINTTNAVIARATESEEISADDKAAAIAQAKFLRAFYYFYAVRMWGAIPTPLEETTGVKLEAHRTPVDQVYSTVIIPDLEAAIPALPVTADAGRATQGAAQHLLALVYLTNPSSTTAEYAKAEQLAKAVIAGPYSLQPVYSDIFIQANEAGPETVFALQTTNDPLTWGRGNTWHLYWLMQYDIEPGMTRTVDYGRPYKRLRPSAYMLDTLFNRSIDNRWDSSFQFVWFANDAAHADALPNGLEIGDTSIYIPQLKSSDPALKAYCGKNYVVYSEPDDFWNYKQFPLGKDECANIKSEYSPRAFPSLLKFQDATRISLNERHSQRDFKVFRLGGTYLLAAEALIREGKPAEALPYVNAIRERGAKPGHEAEMDVGVGDMTLDFILAERARELFAEGHRWFDLVRFHKLVPYLKGRNMDAAPNIDEHFTLRPIPQNQIDLTKNEGGEPFEQNPGYSSAE